MEQINAGTMKQYRHSKFIVFCSVCCVFVVLSLAHSPVLAQALRHMLCFCCKKQFHKDCIS